MENEKWISEGQKVSDVDRRTPPEQGEGPNLAEVVTVPPPDARLQPHVCTDLGDDPEGEAQGDPDGDSGNLTAQKDTTRPPPEPSISPPDHTPPSPRGTEGPSPEVSDPVWNERFLYSTHKTKPMENEKSISEGQKVGDVDRQTPPEQGEGPTSAEVVTLRFDLE